MSKFIGFVLLFVIVMGFVVPQAFLPKAFASERQTQISASRAEVHAVVSDLTTWKDWTIWNKENDPTLEYEYEGSPGEVGQVMRWSGDKFGEGSMTIESVAPERITYTLRFAETGDTKVEMLLDERNGMTAVKWAMNGEMEGMPYQRWIGLMMDRLNGPAFERGLVRLKERFEASAN